MALDKVSIDKLLLLINGIIMCAMTVGLIFYWLRVNDITSVYNTDNISLANNVTVGRKERQISISNTAEFVSFSFGMYALPVILIDIFCTKYNPYYMFARNVKITLCCACTIFPLYIITINVYYYMNDANTFIIDNIFYSANWSSHTQIRFLPALNCDSGTVKVDYDGNYTSEDCWNFKTLNNVYTQCCARWVTEIYPTFNLNELITEYIIDTIAYLFMFFLFAILDVIMTNIRVGSWDSRCNDKYRDVHDEYAQRFIGVLV